MDEMNDYNDSLDDGEVNEVDMEGNQQDQTSEWMIQVNKPKWAQSDYHPNLFCIHSLSPSLPVDPACGCSS